MKKALLYILILYSAIVTFLLISSDISLFQTINRKEYAVNTRNADFIDLIPTCVVDLDTSLFYHESYMCKAFMTYEFRSSDRITTMTMYEAEVRGFDPCPLCDPAYKAYKILK